MLSQVLKDRDPASPDVGSPALRRQPGDQAPLSSLQLAKLELMGTTGAQLTSDGVDVKTDAVLNALQEVLEILGTQTNMLGDIGTGVDSISRTSDQMLQDIAGVSTDAFNNAANILNSIKNFGKNSSETCWTSPFNYFKCVLAMFVRAVCMVWTIIGVWLSILRVFVSLIGKGVSVVPILGLLSGIVESILYMGIFWMHLSALELITLNAINSEEIAISSARATFRSIRLALMHGWESCTPMINFYGRLASAVSEETGLDNLTSRAYEHIVPGINAKFRSMIKETASEVVSGSITSSASTVVEGASGISTGIFNGVNGFFANMFMDSGGSLTGASRGGRGGGEVDTRGASTRIVLIQSKADYLVEMVELFNLTGLVAHRMLNILMRIVGAYLKADDETRQKFANELMTTPFEKITSCPQDDPMCLEMHALSTALASPNLRGDAARFELFPTAYDIMDLMASIQTNLPIGSSIENAMSSAYRRIGIGAGNRRRPGSKTKNRKRRRSNSKKSRTKRRRYKKSATKTKRRFGRGYKKPRTATPKRR